MPINWRRVDTYKSNGQVRVDYISRIEYQPEAVSHALRDQLADLSDKGFKFRLKFVDIHRARIASQNSYSVFTKLTCRRGPIVLRTAVRSEDAFSVESALKTTALGVGILQSSAGPLRLQFDQRESIEKEALDVSDAGSDVADYWHQFEILYESWHDGKLAAVDSLSQSKIRISLRQYTESQLYHLAQKHHQASQLGPLVPRLIAHRWFALPSGPRKSVPSIAGVAL